MDGRVLKDAWVSTVGLLAMVVGACGGSGPPVVMEPKAVWSYVESPDATVSETGVDFGVVALGSRATVRIEVRNEGAAAMIVLPPDGISTGFEIDIPRTGLPVGVGETKLIEVSFRPTEERAYAWSGALVVSDFRDQDHSLALAGEGQASAFTCDRDRLDFGRVLRGRTETLSVNCRNNSEVEGVLIVSPISGEQRTQFGLRTTGDDGRLALAPGGSQEIRVSFKADLVGNAFADLEILAEARGGDAARVASVRLEGTTVGHAVECDPSALDFGFVGPGSERPLEITCVNQASRPFEITGITLNPADSPFSWTPTDTPIVIPAYADRLAGEAKIAVTFGPTILDRETRQNGTLRIATNDETAPRIDVPLTGFAGGPVISCSPALLDFGPVATGLSVTRAFTCSNVGSDDPSRTDDALVVTGVESTNPDEFTAVVRGGLNTNGYLVGQSFSLDVTYRPASDGPGNARIPIFSNDTTHSSQDPYAVMVSGNGHDLPPCEFDIVPPTLRFGVVDRGESATLEFAIRNRRVDAGCIVEHVRLAPTCASAFSLPAGDADLELEILPPLDPDEPGSGEVRYQVRFAPPDYRPTPFTCDVLFDISHPENRQQVVPVRGASQSPCGLISPKDLDFGTVKPGCSSRYREFQILNTCDTPLIIEDIATNAGASNEFWVVSEPLPGDELAPGAAIDFTMAYRPIDDGHDIGSVFVFVQGMDEPYMASFKGRGASDATQVDTFRQRDMTKVDLLWVIDNSGTMSNKQQKLAQNVKWFLAYANDNQIDYHVAVTTSSVGGVSAEGRPAENGRFVGPVITRNTQNAQTLWESMIRVGINGNADEKVLEAAWLALSPPLIDGDNRGFLRPDANLTIIVLSDEIDVSYDSPMFYYTFFRNLKGYQNPHMFTFHAIVGDKGTGCRTGGLADAGDRMIFLAEKTGGMFHSICESDWSEPLRKMAEAAFGFKTCFPLGNQPEDAEEILVLVSGRLTPSNDTIGEIWSYDPAQNAVCFGPESVPEPSSQIEISYNVACL